MVARAVSWFQWHYRSGGNVHTNEVLSFSTKDKDFLIFFLDWMKNASFVLIGQRYCQVKYETILKHLRPIVTSFQRGNTQHYFWLHCRDFQSFLHIFRCAGISWIHNLARLTEINFFSVTQKPILFQIIHESNNDSGTNCQSKTNNTSDSRNACKTSFASDKSNVSNAGLQEMQVR